MQQEDNFLMVIISSSSSVMTRFLDVSSAWYFLCTILHYLKPSTWTEPHHMYKKWRRDVASRAGS